MKILIGKGTHQTWMCRVISLQKPVGIGPCWAMLGGQVVGSWTDQLLQSALMARRHRSILPLFGLITNSYIAGPAQPWMFFFFRSPPFPVCLRPFWWHNGEMTDWMEKKTVDPPTERPIGDCMRHNPPTLPNVSAINWSPKWVVPSNLHNLFTHRLRTSTCASFLIKWNRQFYQY